MRPRMLTAKRAADVAVSSAGDGFRAADMWCQKSPTTASMVEYAFASTFKAASVEGENVKILDVIGGIWNPTGAAMFVWSAGGVGASTYSGNSEIFSVGIPSIIGVRSLEMGSCLVNEFETEAAAVSRAHVSRIKSCAAPSQTE